MDYFSGLTQWLNNTTFYKEHIFGWPEPLNNASLDICLFLFLILAFVVPDIIDRIKNYIAHKRIIRKNLALEEQRADEKLSRKTETENNVLLDQYMKFMLIAQMQKTGMDVTFEQFKTAQEQKPLVKENNSVVEENLKETNKSKNDVDTINVESESIKSKSLKKKFDMASFIEGMPKFEKKPKLAKPIKSVKSIKPEKVKEQPKVIKPVEEIISKPECPPILAPIEKPIPVLTPVDEVKNDIVEEEKKSITNIPEVIDNPEDMKSTELNDNDLLPETEMVDIGNDDDIPTIPVSDIIPDITEDIKDEEPEETEPDKKDIEDINELLAKKAEEENAEPIQIDQSDVDDFTALMSKIKASKTTAENASTIETQKNICVQQNMNILNKQVNKAIISDAVAAKKKSDIAENKELDAQKAEAVKQKEKEAAKLKKLQEKAEAKKNKKSKWGF